MHMACRDTIDCDLYTSNQKSHVSRASQAPDSSCVWLETAFLAAEEGDGEPQHQRLHALGSLAWWGHSQAGQSLRGQVQPCLGNYFVEDSWQATSSISEQSPCHTKEQHHNPEGCHPKNSQEFPITPFGALTPDLFPEQPESMNGTSLLSSKPLLGNRAKISAFSHLSCICVYACVCFDTPGIECCCLRLSDSLILALPIVMSWKRCLNSPDVVKICHIANGSLQFSINRTINIEGRAAVS